jgi:hypothetical protein
VCEEGYSVSLMMEKEGKGRRGEENEEKNEGERGEV